MTDKPAPTSTLADALSAVGGKTSDLATLTPIERNDLRRDLDVEIAAFHAEGKEHPDPKIAAKYPLNK